MIKHASDVVATLSQSGESRDRSVRAIAWPTLTPLPSSPAMSSTSVTALSEKRTLKGGQLAGEIQSPPTSHGRGSQKPPHRERAHIPTTTIHPIVPAAAPKGRARRRIAFQRFVAVAT